MSKSIETKSSGCLGWVDGGEEWRVIAHECMVSFWGDGNVSEPDAGGGYTNLSVWEMTMNYAL